MAIIKSIEFEDGKVSIKLQITKDEYNALRNKTEDIMILPKSIDALDEKLTIGKTGVTNQLSLPKTILKRHNIDDPPKKAHAMFFECDGCQFMLVKLKGEK